MRPLARVPAIFLPISCSDCYRERMAFSLGIDFGTNSVRALLVDCATGAEAGTSVFGYPSGKQGVLLDPKDVHLARQHPGDYLAGLEACVRGAIAAARSRVPGFDPADVIAIGVDTTGSSPIPVDANNVPIALQDRWAADLAAQCWLWKDHTSWAEAAEITRIAAKHRPQFLAKCGNTYSSEWFWSKILHVIRASKKVREEAWSWVEHCDWIPALLTGITDPLIIKRSRCAAG